MILLRHPRPAVAAGLCYGRLDLAPGPGAAAEIARALATTPPVTAVWASPARRVRPLARALAARDAVPLVEDPRLWELDFGAWEGLAWSAIDRGQSDPWADDPWTLAPPGGESFAALSARVAEVQAAAPPGAALVCHAGPIRALWMRVEGLSLAQAFARPVPYAAPLRLGTMGGGGNG